MGVRRRSAVQHGIRLGQLRGRRVRVRAMSHAGMVVHGRLLADQIDLRMRRARPELVRGVGRQTVPGQHVDVRATGRAAPLASATRATRPHVTAGPLHQPHPGPDRLRDNRVGERQEVRRARAGHGPNAGLRFEPPGAPDLHRARRKPDLHLLREQRQSPSTPVPGMLPIDLVEQIVAYERSLP